MIKAIIFDYDGTLSNRQLSVYSFFRDFLKDYVPQLNEMEFEAMLQDLMLFDANGIAEFEYRSYQFLARYGHLFPEGFEKTFKDEFIARTYTYNILKDETVEVLEKLQGKYKLAVLSNGDSTVQHNKIRHVGIEKYFDEIIVTGDLGVHKPETGPFEYAMKKLGVTPEETLMVGDVFATDILGAYRAGIKTVWIIEDSERPNYSYKGYRIRKLNELFEILEKEAQ